ncbi:SDR family NAD(P)-dependent oxidoreductase [Granulicella arctica]|uniref:SDR family NAD(P)-dependent oxidoreductase n=1 Tax=Granulicella arctica TaxID=940613 RepID=UPI0021E04DFF|nr:SDR family NAD(P)-dependent oxidoreductase [Granulicella arctica]
MDQASAFATYPSLKERVVVITGGASGIGESLVQAFAMQHARVVYLDLQEEAGTALAEQIVEAGYPKPSFHQCDLTNIAALQSTLATILQTHGRIDVLVNNAGNDTRHTIEEVTSESWDQSIAVNLKHQFFMCQGVIPSMRAQGRGSIINMSSIGWVIPSTHLPVYVTSKAAIVGMTRTLAHELGPDNIRVNSVMPGAILTDRQRRLWLTDAYKAEVLGRQALKRLLLPEEVARLILFLASDDSSAITNQSYVIDGGWI